MPLHRDIHWIGRQWAVTGLGMQLIDQKLKGFFDIEVPQLWDEALIETMRAKEWLNVADFDKGLEVARKRFPPGGVTQPETIAPAPPVAPTVCQAAPPVTPAPVVVPPIAPIEPPPQIAKLEEPRPPKPDPIKPPPAPPVILRAIAIPTPEPEPAQSVPPKFQMVFSGYAKFVRPWRVRMRE
ncbi:hypothetical protein JQ634_14210 [Bradyrhizobium sp. AUGA SZCCT0240]|uniref:hypothetical protein n=1 Tax=unclassified Bradyrhizobium TaxID=2631580 RepID=UPI001BAA6AAF|nr:MULTISPECIES: hypothetical protein [unclassified Bradyrhizobium]MBR1200884.1 hypothetical protein [Bradyrhizobium sp. AUGA SZCCT0158]MBR1243363.1 hypothetical protein [Bradyrhizobium sp. AUGA SZCCT0274]MBR1254852.1 hypothetical protein [Bradyrhizobium sp. AUGA SZCCT0240]